MKYILEHPISGQSVKNKYESIIKWRNGIIRTDEPPETGGQDKGPDPYTLLLSSLVACTIATLNMYLEIHNIKLLTIEVEANMIQKLEQEGLVMHIERSITFRNHNDKKLQEKLLRVADNCSVAKLLSGKMKITTTVRS
ncbi:OsmC family peroxiredoxin [Chryseobacterium shandongense]|uniref:OsmC family peroxiredoxin n=1 Tax=Chryseobacterium shandongense TaxID=1493872 RepID=A0AAD1DKE0_9FLAO|nr:OsmC family protein [Chryseobacterium shandongense]AZA85491.1 OsmC family peroxiredoxin [Chryseobacterium shandongense]AZA97598.1 OsmC family peroxiredoxin [Chryseobacterium shandongense]